MAIPPPTGERYLTPGQLPLEARQSLEELLSLLADNKLALGRHYADWSVSSPILESSVALAAMAQDELGHARSFYPLLRTFAGKNADADTEERGWPAAPRPMQCLAGKIDAWEKVVAANFLPDAALTVFLEAAADSSFEPLRQRAGKIVLEERTHWAHATSWVARLVSDDRTRERVAQALRPAWSDALAWLGPDDDPALRVLAETGIIADGGLRTRFARRIGPVLEQNGLADVLPAADRLDWGSWQPATRSFTDGGG